MTYQHYIDSTLHPQIASIRRSLSQIEQCASLLKTNEHNFDAMLRTIAEKAEGVVDLYRIEAKRRGVKLAMAVAEEGE